MIPDAWLDRVQFGWVVCFHPHWQKLRHPKQFLPSVPHLRIMLDQKCSPARKSSLYSGTEAKSKHCCLDGSILLPITFLANLPFFRFVKARSFAVHKQAESFVALTLFLSDSWKSIMDIAGMSHQVCQVQILYQC